MMVAGVDFASLVNTIMLVLIFPGMGLLYRMQTKSAEAASEEARLQAERFEKSADRTGEEIAKLNKSLNEFAAAIVGVGGHGGILEEMSGIRRRVHKLESAVTALLVETKIALPDFNGINLHRDRGD